MYLVQCYYTEIELMYVLFNDKIRVPVTCISIDYRY